MSTPTSTLISTFHLPHLSSKMGSLLPILPEDILGLFCLHLPNSALKQCCLTSNSFRYFSKPLLFEHVTIQNSTDAMGPSVSDEDLKFWEALTVDSDIGALVKSLELRHADFNSTHHWLKSFQSEPKLAYIMTHLPNLTNFAITRYSPPHGIPERCWERPGWLELTFAIQHILNLPTLRNFHFCEQYDFQNPGAFRQLFRLTGPSAIRSFHLHGGKLFEEYQPSSSSVPAIYQANVTNLRLYYIDETPSVGLRLILSLISPASPLNVTNLSSLELSAIGVQDETWIPAILNAQKTDSTLQHLGLFVVEGYPKNERFIQSLSRFTSIRKLSVSEANSPIFTYQALKVGGIKFGFVAAWMSALPTNIISTVEELDIHIEVGYHWSYRLHGVDELLSSSSLNLMRKVKNVVLHVEATREAPEVEKFLREKWHFDENNAVNSDPDQRTLRK